MAVKAGYKQTEVGVIPEDWEVKKLGELASFRTGPFGSALHKSDYTDDGVPVINPMHIVDGKLLPSRSMTITEKAAVKLSEFRLKVNEVVIGRRGDMGRCAVVRQEHDGWLCGTGSMIVRTTSRIDANFLQRILSSPSVISAIEDSSVGTTMINLNQGTLRGLFIQTPTLAEQTVIATALSDADTLIESLEQLIHKKRNIKQGAMQELLAGKKRLPGFSGEWEVRKLKNVVITIPGGIFGVEKSGPSLRAMPVATTAHISDEDRWNGKEMPIRYFSENQIGEYAVKDGDLVVVKSSGSAASIKSGKIGLVSSEESGRFIFSNFLMVLRSESINSKFLYYYQTSNNVKKLLPSLVEASTYPNIRRNEYLAIDIPVPPPHEQAAIAAILSDMDADIAALEEKLNKAKAVKQGMMQELLTGRVRLV